MRLPIQSIICLLFFAICTTGQQPLPTIRSNSSTVTIQDGDNVKKDGWTLAPEAKPDVYEADLKNGKAHKVTFITDVDSISFLVEEGKRYDFVIQHGEDLCYTQIVGIRSVPAAVFDQEYQATHRGKILVEIPEVYELVNIAIAMTPIGIEDKNFIYKNSEYYSTMRQWFDKYKDHPLLVALNSDLTKNPGRYFSLKMNGYSFEFDSKGKIVQSRIYDRTGFTGEISNSLKPYLPQLQSFSVLGQPLSQPGAWQDSRGSISRDHRMVRAK